MEIEQAFDEILNEFTLPDAWNDWAPYRQQVTDLILSASAVSSANASIGQIAEINADGKGKASSVHEEEKGTVSFFSAPGHVTTSISAVCVGIMRR